MAEEDVDDQLQEAGAAHEEAEPTAAGDAPGGLDTVAGEGNQPEGTGYAPPDPGVEEAPESEIPVGVDALDPEKVQAAEAAGDDDGGGGAVDVSAAVEGVDAPTEGEADAEEAEAEPTAEAEAEAEAEPAEDAEAEPAEEAEAAPPADEAEAKPADEA